MKEWGRTRQPYKPDVQQGRHELEEDLEPGEHWRGILLLKLETTGSQETFTLLSDIEFLRVSEVFEISQSKEVLTGHLGSSQWEILLFKL